MSHVREHTQEHYREHTDTFGSSAAIAQLLLEDDAYLLLEDGAFLLLEANS